MIRVNVSLANASVTETETLTAGRVGLECGFTFSSEWDDLLKVAVFEGEQTIEVALGKATVAVIPPECMATAGYNLRIGVYGLSPANAIVIPTVWAKAGKIKDSAGPDEDSFAPATPELVAQIMSASETALSIAQGVAADAEAGEFDGVSPTVAVTETTGGHTVTITDRDGNHSFDVMDGASAYAQAVEGGYTESEQQFNTDLARFKTYAAEAESSANAAAASENNAGDSATAAASSATAALNAKTAAEQAKTAAAQSSSNAATAANNANTKAGEAAQSAASAASSAATAAQKASEASASATAAAGSATNAGSAASAAAASATAAGNAQTAAETAQGKAEDAQEAAEAVLESIPADYTELTEDVADLKSRVEQLEQGGSGLLEDRKQALLAIARSVVYSTPNGQELYNALYNAFYPPANLVGITAVYTQSGIVTSASALESLKSDLVVTALYSDGTSVEVNDYVLSGTLTTGTSTITVTYSGKTTEFTVNVIDALYMLPESTVFDGTNYIDTEVKLASEDRDYTIMLSETNGLASQYGPIFHCITESNPYPGLAVQAYNNMYVVGGFSRKNVDTDASSIVGDSNKIVMRHEAGSQYLYVDYTTNGVRGEQLIVDNGGTFAQSNNNLLIGCYQQTNGNKGRFWKGTVHDFVILSNVIDDNAVDEYLGV